MPQHSADGGAISLIKHINQLSPYTPPSGIEVRKGEPPANDMNYSPTG
ncbi:hypothetical protein UUU_12610 [Klebsiella pneumoniae subsp. pneumoniae DSM 30104 = JCM 1662 = NBRC 14940]|nr:hypothetical protein UUU_12610 [Klebsiella pneumoniae subsp. pneumoniae DSM 30104 = JCM 1662 = NBRC 14940]